MNTETPAKSSGPVPFICAFMVVMTAFILFMCSGCASFKKQANDAGIIQAALETILPPGFEGDLDADHDGYYFGTSVHLEIEMTGLKQVDGRWTWSGGGYKRKGFFSQGGVKLTPKPPTK
jgi:hypothetical protein